MPTTSQKKPVRYMDFVSHKPKANADPLASRPASRPVAKPKPVEKVHSVADQIPPKGAQKPAQKPVDHHPERTPKIVTTNTVPVKKKEEKPYISRTPAPKPAPKAPDNNAYSLGGKSPFLPNYSVDKRPLSDSVPTKKRDNYEKLSFLGVDEKSTPRKNVYDKPAEPAEKPEKDKKDKEPKTVKVIDDTKKKRGIPTWLVIILTIILGAAVGAGVYFLLPK